MGSWPPQSAGEHKEHSARREWVVLAILCAIGAAAVIRRVVALETQPPRGPAALVALDGHFRAKAGTVLLHIVPSLLFVLLLPLQFISSLRRRRPRLHRWIGRSAMSLGLVLGI